MINYLFIVPSALKFQNSILPRELIFVSFSKLTIFISVPKNHNQILVFMTL
jgi:hypothetical protein